VRKSPKGKLPFIEDGTQKISDSRDILAHLERTASTPLDAGITAAEQALSIAFRALFEEELYFYALALRWQPDASWHVYAPTMREYLEAIGLPRPLIGLALPVVRRGSIRHAWHQGAGRHSEAEINARAIELANAIETQLGAGPYFFGPAPRCIDATAYAFLCGSLWGPFDSAFQRHLRTLPNIVSYAERIRDQYYAQGPSR
jgi:glutathione S-transferase